MTQNLAHNLESKPRTEDVCIKEDYNFNTLLLPQSILRGLQQAGFHKPSPVQIKAIPLGRCGLDLIIKAKSGTGKTVVFTVIALDMINVAKDVQVLVIAPTREIAVQIKDVIQTIGKEIQNLRVESFIGGLPTENDIKNCKGCHIAVGTPGRLKELIEKNHLKTNSIRLFILDEVDKLMDASLEEDVKYMFCKTPERKQILTTSATYTPFLLEFLKSYMLSPTFITPGTDNPLLLGLRQFVTIVQSHLNIMQQVNIKTSELIRLLSSISFTQCIIFSNYQTRAQSISNTLNQRNWNTMYISGAQSQPERLKVIEDFKKLRCRILLTTDLTARGIDASDVDLVINYDVPNDTATYLHRMGRAGRYGSNGLCVTIAADGSELRKLQYIIGEIGGSELHIAKLPEEGKLMNEIWSAELNSFETINGLVNNQSTDSSVEVKKSILELKTFKDKTEVKLESVSQGDENRSVNGGSTEPNIESNPIQFKKASKKKKKRRRSKLVKTETTTNNIENPSPSDVFSVKEETEEVVDPASLYQWVPVEGDSVLDATPSGDNLLGSCEENDTDESTKEPKKRKNGSPRPDINTEKKRNLLTKNVALFNLTDLLTSTSNHNVDSHEESDVVKSVQSYLNVLDEKETESLDSLQKQFENVNCTDLLSNIVAYTESSQNAVEIKSETVKDPLENVLNFGYDFMIENGPNWTVALGDRYENIQETEDNVTTEDDGDVEKEESVISENLYTESEENGAYGVNKLDEEESQAEHSVQEDYSRSYRRRDNNRFRFNRNNYLQNAEYNFQQHYNNMPDFNSENTTGLRSNVQKTDFMMSHRDSEYINHPAFNSYYNYYSEMLRNTALTFEDVPSFTEWFNEWESQLDSLTGYVQQNIYLEEMNKFQRNRWYKS